MPTALIADDEQHLAEYLRARLTALWPELDIVAMAGDGVEALDLFEAHKPDILFLDIRMPGLSGIDVASRLTRPARIVFVTAYDQYAVKAFEHAAADYLLKPVSEERLVKTIERLKSVEAPPGADSVADLIRQLQGVIAPGTQNRLKWIRAAVGSSVRLIDVEEVCYFEAQDKYTQVATAENEMLIRVPIKDLIDQLDPHRFWQIHRGTIVNASEIAGTGHDLRGRLIVKLKKRKETLVVSRAFTHLFRQM